MKQSMTGRLSSLARFAVRIDHVAVAGVVERELGSKAVGVRLGCVEGDLVDVADFAPRHGQTLANGLKGEECRVLDPTYPLFFDGSHDATVTQDDRGRVVVGEEVLPAELGL